MRKPPRLGILFSLILTDHTLHSISGLSSLITLSYYVLVAGRFAVLPYHLHSTAGQSSVHSSPSTATMKFECSIFVVALATAALAVPAPYPHRAVVQRWVVRIFSILNCLGPLADFQSQVNTRGSKLPANYVSTVRQLAKDKLKAKRQLDQLLSGLTGAAGGAGAAADPIAGLLGKASGAAGGAGGAAAANPLGDLLGGAAGAGAAGASTVATPANAATPPNAAASGNAAVRLLYV